MPAKKYIRPMTDKNEQKVWQVLILGDQRVVNEWLEICFKGKSNIIVVGVGSHAQAGSDAFSVLKPDVVLANVSQKQSAEARFFKNLVKQFPKSQILVATENGDATLAERIFRTGILGLVTNYKDMSEFVRAIETVGRKQVYLEKKLAAKLIQQAFTTTSSVPTISQKPQNVTLDAVLPPQVGITEKFATT